MIYEVRARIWPVMGDFPFAEVDYFNSRDEAEAYAKEMIKREDVNYVTVTKILKAKTKVIRSFEK